MAPENTGEKRKHDAGAKNSTIPAISKKELFHQTFYADSSSGDDADGGRTVRGALRRKRGHRPKHPRTSTPEPPTLPGSKADTTNKNVLEEAGSHSTLISGPNDLQLKTDLSHTLARSNFPLHKRLKGFEPQLDTILKSEVTRIVSEKVTFMSLPPEIRQPIYRFAVVDPDCTVDLTARNNLERSGQLLRVCRTIYEEARVLLYGENSFHLTRAHKQRGEYYEVNWKEIGYKDIYRFLNDIGPHNIVNLRYVSIEFEDALPTLTTYFSREEAPERRYVNDPTLIAVLTILGKHAELDKFVAGFRGSRNTSIADYHFLKALCSIRCHQFACDSIGPTKIRPEALENVKKLIETKATPDKKVPYMHTDRQG